MRHTLWLLILVAGTGSAQWRRFGDGRAAAAPSGLARETLAAHNAVRARVGAAPLAWSDRLAARARIGRTLSWRASNSPTARTRSTVRTCSRSRARPHRRH